MGNISDLIIPKFVDAALKPVAKEAAEYRDIRMNLFLEEVEKKFRKIPEENIVNPPLNIVGPALECVAKFYYEEKHLRELFAHLITASMNKDILPEVHPAFIEIIKQLGLNDVTILNSNYLY